MVYRYKLSRNLRLLLLPGVSVLFVIASLAGEFSYQVNEREAFVERLQRTQDCEIYITGSSAHMLSREIATQMRGRAVSWGMIPFISRKLTAACPFPPGNG